MNGPPTNYNNFPSDWTAHGSGHPHQQPGQAHQLSVNAVARQQQQQLQFNQGINSNVASFLNANAGVGNGSNQMAMAPNSDLDSSVLSEENRRVLDWIAQLLHRNTRETALLELSKKREQVPDLALLLWYSYGKW
jgi:CCR4-NOT transcription complex subunit 9